MVPDETLDDRMYDSTSSPLLGIASVDSVFSLRPSSSFFLRNVNFFRNYRPYVGS